MSTIFTYHWYTLEEVAQFRDNPAMADIVMKGYVLQHDPVNHRVQFVHEKDAAKSMGQKGNSFGLPVEQMFDKTELPRIEKRTPQQRMASLMEKVGPDLHFYLSGQAGHEVSGETVQRVAQEALQAADDEFEKRERKLIVRTTGNPYA